MVSAGERIMQSQILQIIQCKQITTVFQPIIDTTRSEIVGYEALTRGPENTSFYSPEVLFKAATELGYLSALEILCRNSAIKKFATLGLKGKLFLNVSPMILLNPDHPQGETVKMVQECGLSCEQIVIEISEKYPIPSTDLLHQALEKYRHFGFQVAIDDLGAGYSGLKQWSALRPDIVKIDRYFIADCHQDVIKREFLRTIFELGRSTNAQVIAEGIESEAEYELLAELGMTLAQGYLLAKPVKEPIVQCPVLKQSMQMTQHYHHLGTVKTLVCSAQTVTSCQNAAAIYQLFSEQPRLQCLPVLDKNKPVGIIYREHLMECFSDIYGRALFAKKNATQVMDEQPLIIEHDTLLDDASIYLTQLSDAEFSRYFIVAEQGYYMGLASMRELLRRITEAKIENARYANPLTLLPGNVPIDQEIDYLLTKNMSFHLAYFDLNHFKPFNDVYGYAKGDLLLKQLAKIIVDSCPIEHCFVGHVGGDDFVVLFKMQNFTSICERIIAEFSQQVRVYFQPEHIQQQGYESYNRSGEKTFFPLVSLSIGVISPDVTRCFSTHEISTMAADAKAQAKKLPGNGLFVCRRRSLQSNEHWPLNRTA